jgi:microcystin-dependent protein
MAWLIGSVCIKGEKMALDYFLQYPGKVLPPDADYPQGKAKPVTAPGSGDGTPWSAPLLNDLWAFFQKVLVDSGQVPSGVPDTAQISQYFDGLQSLIGVKPGQASMWMSENPVPSGWLVMNGAAVSRVTYAELFAEIGVLYGDGDGVSTFNLPDVRGYFPRFQDSGAGRDPDAGGRIARPDGTSGDNVGTTQNDQIEQHSHDVRHYVDSPGAQTPKVVGGLRGDTFSTSASQPFGGNETRPLNMYVVGIIKY